MMTQMRETGYRETRFRETGFRVLVFSLAGFLAAADAFAADALLVRKTGPVTVTSRRTRRLRLAKAGMELHFGDTVKTARGAKAQIVFPDGKTVLIKERTTLRLAGKAGAVRIHIARG